MEAARPQVLDDSGPVKRPWKFLRLPYRIAFTEEVELQFSSPSDVGLGERIRRPRKGARIFLRKA